MLSGRSITPKVNTRNLMSFDGDYQNVSINLFWVFDIPLQRCKGRKDYSKKLNNDVLCE